MEVALVRQQLRRRDMLEGDRVVRGTGYDRVTPRVVMCCGKQCGDVGKYAFAELKGIRRRRYCAATPLANLTRQELRGRRDRDGRTGPRQDGAAYDATLTE
jgi:hypothetical protein